MISILSFFTLLFVSGVADLYPRIVYPLFFVLEEVIDSLLMVLFWQIGMLCFTKEEAKRLIGIVNMGAAFANLANGLTVAVLIHFFNSFAILPAQMVLLLLQLIPNAVCGRWTKALEAKSDDDVAGAAGKAGGRTTAIELTRGPGGAPDGEKPAWWKHPF